MSTFHTAPYVERHNGDVTGEDPPRTCLDVVPLDERWSSIGAHEDLFLQAVTAAISQAGRQPEAALVTLALASDAEVATLNARFLNKNGATNVLAFPSPAQASSIFPAQVMEQTPLGDIILAYETVMAEAEAEGKNPLHHAVHLAVHGTLHLLGYDHGSETEALRMEALETAVLAAFGIPGPYGFTAIIVNGQLNDKLSTETH